MFGYTLSKDTTDYGKCEQMTDKDILKEIHEKIANIPIPYDSRDNADVQYGECLIRNAILHIVSEYLQRSDNDT